MADGKINHGKHSTHSPFFSVSSFPYSGFSILRPFILMGIKASC